MLALTGTATPEVYDSVVNRLSLKDPIIVGLSPSRDNIKYYIEPPLSVKKFCELFAEKICCSRIECPKTLIFCSSIPECSLMYRTLRTLLGNEFVEPPAGFISGGGGGEHSPLLGFGLPPLGNFDLKVNQFKYFEIFNSCTMHNKC